MTVVAVSDGGQLRQHRRYLTPCWRVGCDGAKTTVPREVSTVAASWKVLRVVPKARYLERWRNGRSRVYGSTRGEQDAGRGGLGGGS